MSGALAERVFAEKLEKVGFEEVRIRERHPFGLADARDYPLFTPDLIELMGELLPPEQQERVATGITVAAVRPG